MTGIIVSTPPTVEPPPSNTGGSTTVLGPLSYTPAIPTLPQTWTGIQTFQPGTVIFSGTGAPSNVVMQEMTNGALTVRKLAFTDISGSIGISQIPASALTSVSDTNVTLTLGGSPTAALLAATSITVGWSGTLAANRGGFGADVSAQSGVPLFATGVPTFTGTTGSGTFVRATSPTITSPTISTSATIAAGADNTTFATVTGAGGNGRLIGLIDAGGNVHVRSQNGLTFSLGVNASDVFTVSATGATLVQPLTYGGVTANNAVTGTGNLVLSSSPTLVTPALGTPASGVLTNCTGLPVSGLSTQAAYTIIGNFTGSAAVPTVSAIGGLPQKASPAATDLIMLQDQGASGALKYATVSSIASAGSVSSIAGNTGAFTLGRGITNSTNVLLADPLFHRGYLSGCVTSNDGVAPNTKINVTAGVWCDDTQAILINGASGSIDCTTTGANGLDTGSLAASTWYYTFAIAKTDGTNAYLASTAATSPTFPSGYTLKRRIGAFKTDGAAHIFGFTQRGQEFYWASPVRDYTITPIATTSSVTVTLASVPPSIVVEAIIIAGVTGGSGAAVLYVRALTEIDIAPSYANGTVSVRDPTSTNGGGVSALRIWTNTSQQIAYRSSTTAASSEVDIMTLGWFDTLGK